MAATTAHGARVPVSPRGRPVRVTRHTGQRQAVRRHRRHWSARNVEDRHSAAASLRSYARRVRLPVVGKMAVPQPDKVAYYAGMGVLAALQLIEWPLALVVTAGHLLADQHLSRVARGAGEALEAV